MADDLHPIVPTAAPIPPKAPTDAELDALFDKVASPVEKIIAPVAEKLPAVKVEATPTPEKTPAAPVETPKPAPAATSVAVAATEPEKPEPEPPQPTLEDEQAAILAMDAEIQRRAAAFTKKHGRTVRDPAEITADVEGDSALRQMREEFPDFHKAVTQMLRPYVQKGELALQLEELRGKVETGEMTVAEARDEAALAGAHSDFGLIKEHPEKLNEWIDSLPYREGAKAARAIEFGTPAQAAEEIGRFKKAKGISHYSELLTPKTAQSGGAATVPESAPAARKAPAVNPERLAAAMAMPGEGTTVPITSKAGAVLTEKDLDKYFDSITR